ncbi:Hypothetical predicted protein [Octopus vulgaris]|uniref:Uncharacterized protein n=1 Tax=Octopus vulgaris TaxID=6645 RepID=A0AA36BPX1_OCTVU|nr:Hypothetical predicted protein [Octopus vulgaris]
MHNDPYQAWALMMMAAGGECGGGGSRNDGDDGCGSDGGDNGGGDGGGGGGGGDGGGGGIWDGAMADLKQHGEGLQEIEVLGGGTIWGKCNPLSRIEIDGDILLVSYATHGAKGFN